MSAVRSLLVLAILAGLSSFATASTVVYVSEDESVLSDGNATSPDDYDGVSQHYWYSSGGNQYLPSWTTGGVTYDHKPGLFSGVFSDGTSLLLGRFYLKFDLRTLGIPEGCYITSATLYGNYDSDRSPSADTTHRIYLAASDNWRAVPLKTVDELNADPSDPPSLPTAADGITWNNQPGYTGGPLGSFTPSALGWYSWDITSVFRDAYAGDDVLSLMFKADDETLDAGHANMEQFGEFEDGGPECCAFQILFDYTAAVPEPSAAIGLLGIAVAGGLIAAWRRLARLKG